MSVPDHDNLREQDRIMGLFLGRYNKLNSSAYEVYARPEQDSELKKRVGPCDYLLRDNCKRLPELALEVTRLYKDRQNVAENSQLYKHDDKKRNFRLFLKSVLRPRPGLDIEQIRFNKLPAPKDYQVVADDIQKFIDNDSVNTRPHETIFRRKIEVRNSPVSYTIRINRMNPKESGFPHLTLDGNRFEGDGQIANALQRVLEDNQSKLQMAKNAGKSTMLLIDNRYCYAEIDELKEHFCNMLSNIHNGVDTIYALDEMKLENGLLIEKLK